MNEDRRFVMVIVAVLGDRVEEGGVRARREDELGWSTHDGRLVEGKEGKFAQGEAQKHIANKTAYVMKAAKIVPKRFPP